MCRVVARVLASICRLPTSKPVCIVQYICICVSVCLIWLLLLCVCVGQHRSNNAICATGGAAVQLSASLSTVGRLEDGASHGTVATLARSTYCYHYVCCCLSPALSQEFDGYMQSLPLYYMPALRAALKRFGAAVVPEHWDGQPPRHVHFSLLVFFLFQQHFLFICIFLI